MTEVSSLLYVGLDPDSGFPSSLVGMNPEDTITSSLLPDQVRNVTTYVTNTSATSLNVTSVNGKLGPGVTLNPDDLDDSSTTHKFVTQQLINKVQDIEASATRDQTDAEIETAYNNQVAQISAGEITAGTETSVRRFSPSDVSAMIDTHGVTDHGGLAGLGDDDHTQYVLADGTRDIGGSLTVSTLNISGNLSTANSSTVTVPRGYISTSQDRFAVDGSGIGSGADNLYVTNGAGPFIYYETSTNGSVRNGANEFGLGAVPTYTVSSTPDSYLSGTVPAFYDQDTYCRTIVSSTGVYEIQSMLNLSAASEIDVIYNIKIDNVAIANLADTIVGVASPHFRIVKLQAVKFLTAGQEIRVSLTAGANHLIGSGSNLLIRRIG
jgi:hypothetical protein